MPIADFGDVLGSPVWTVLATVFAAVAIWVSIWLYRRQRTRKSLSYEIKVTELVSVHQAAKGHIKILFDEEVIGQVHLISIKIRNDGNVPVLPEDFQQAIYFDLGEGATALTTDVTEVTPADLPAQVYGAKNLVDLEPLLLNPGDGLAIKVFARNLREKVKCHYRIVGVSKMNESAGRAERQAQLTVLGRRMREDVLSRVAALVTLTAATALLAGVFFSPEKKTESLVELTNDEQRCGKIIQTSDQFVFVQEADSGRILRLPTGQVRRIEDDAC